MNTIAALYLEIDESLFMYQSKKRYKQHHIRNKIIYPFFSTMKQQNLRTLLT